MLATPVLLWLGQSLPAASAPAPGPHTQRLQVVFTTISARQSFPDCSGTFSVTGRAMLRDLRERKLFWHRRLSASRLPDERMGLSTGFIRRRSSAASLGMLATPDSFRLNQSPLGAFHQPQAPTIRRTRFVTEGPFANSGEVTLSTALAVFRAISFGPHGTRTLMWAKSPCLE